MQSATTQMGAILTRWAVALSIVLAGTTRGAEEHGAEILVERDEQRGTVEIIVPSQNGLVSSDRIVQGLAAAANLDGDQIPLELDAPWFDLTRPGPLWAIRGLSAATPDVKMRVVAHPESGEPALHIRFERDDLQDKVFWLKRVIRDQLGGQKSRFGLRLDERWEGQPHDRPVVVLVHGYTAGNRSLEPLRRALTDRGWPCATFIYPNDGPLLPSIRLLSEELKQLEEQIGPRRVAIIAHSMGGLIARGVVEDPERDPGNVDRLILVCTPNHGTQWAEVPGGLDYWEHLPSLPEKTIREVLRGSIADGLNEARADLKPGSRVLTRLNGRGRNPRVAYTVILGTAGLVTEQQRERLRASASKWLRTSRPGRLLRPRVESFLEGLDEVQQGRGDGVVAVDRGRLDGVDDTLLLPLNHWTLCHQLDSPEGQQLLDVLLERLSDGVPVR